MRHHDGGIQGRKIQSRNGNIVISGLGVDDGGALVLLVRALAVIDRKDQVVLASMAQQLRDDL